MSSRLLSLTHDLIIIPTSVLIPWLRIYVRVCSQMGLRLIIEGILI